MNKCKTRKAYEYSFALSEQMQKKHISIRRLQLACGISNGAVYAYVLHGSIPNMVTAIKICDLLDWNVYEWNDAAQKIKRERFGIDGKDS